jgi:hypothetical protein
MVVIVSMASSRKSLSLFVPEMGGLASEWNDDVRLRRGFCYVDLVMDLVARFLLGGVVVSFFAVLGDALKPKSCAGLMSAAPSVALATISLTVLKQGKAYAAIEAMPLLRPNRWSWAQVYFSSTRAWFPRF